MKRRDRFSEAFRQCDPRKRRKAVWAAYLFWLFAGSIGGHRLYLGRYRAAIGQLVLCVLGLATLPLSKLGLIWFAALAVWVMTDLVLIPRWVARHNLALSS